MLCSIVGLFRLQSSKTACIGTESGLGQLPELRSTRGGVAGLEQRGVEQREIPRGRSRLGPSEARCAPLVRLLLLSDPGSWCSGTRRGLGHLPLLCFARGGIAGLELLLLSGPGSWCSGTRRGLGQLPRLCFARGGIAGLEQRGVEQHESPRGRCRLGAVGSQVRPSGAAVSPL